MYIFLQYHPAILEIMHKTIIMFDEQSTHWNHKGYKYNIKLHRRNTSMYDEVRIQQPFKMPI